MPSHGRAGLLTRPNLRKSSSTGFNRSIGTIMLTCSALPSRSRSSCSEPMPISSPRFEISPVPPQFGMRGMGEDRFIQQIFPIAGEFLLGGDLARDRSRAPAGAADHDAVADLARPPTSRAAADRGRGRPSACTRPKPDSKSKPSAWPSHHAAVAEMQPDRFGLGDEIADGQHQPVVDQHAIAGAFGAERLRAEGIGRNDRMQPDHRSQRAVEIETVIAGTRLVCRRHFPFGQRGHRGLLRWGVFQPTPRHPNRSRGVGDFSAI